MYNPTFALTVILVISATHLFLGFATAMLMGHGPKRLPEIKLVVVPLRISFPRWPLARRPKPNPVNEQGDEPGDQNAAANESTADQRHSTGEADKPGVAKSPEKIVLASRTRQAKRTEEPPEKHLEDELETWRQGELRDETPSMSGVRFELHESELESETYKALSDAVHKRIRRQVRRDRRVLGIDDNQFAWFSTDVPPEDALMPAERIRQTLMKTQFKHQGVPVHITVGAAVVAGLPEDTPEGLLQRLHKSLQYVLEKAADAPCLDTGDGPREITPRPVEVREAECEL
ncbi:MAG: hypothetical protein ACODAD_03815 [Planctomycetota bacterium]